MDTGGYKKRRLNTMITFRIILILIAFVILFTLGWQNQTAVDVQVFGRTFYNVPLAFVLLYSFAFGALCVGIFTIVSEIRLRTRLHKQHKEIEALTDELRALRNFPLEIITPLEEEKKSSDAPKTTSTQEEE